jgi:3',5'-cyclic AMP phosphodiesterase CpdA
MDLGVALRAALVQGVTLVLSAVALGAALPRSFFVSWGWLAGPGVWLACALVTALALRLPPARVLAGAAVCGLPSLVTVLLGVHWAGAPVAVVLLAVWCGRLAAGRRSGSAPATA